MVCVALEINAPNEELMAFVHIDSQIDLRFSGNHLRIGRRYEIDIAEVSVKLSKIFQALLQLFGGEHIARSHPEDLASDEVGSAEQLHPDELEVAQRV